MEILSSKECDFIDIFTQEIPYSGVFGRVACTPPDTNPSRYAGCNREASTQGRGPRGRSRVETLRVPDRRPPASHRDPDGLLAAGTTCDISRIGTRRATRAVETRRASSPQTPPRPHVPGSVCGALAASESRRLST